MSSIKEEDELLEDNILVKGDDEEVEDDEIVNDLTEYPSEDIVVGKPGFTVAYDAAYLLECPSCKAVFSNRLTFCPGCLTMVPDEVRRKAKIRRGASTDHRFTRYPTHIK